jgi:D-sedoheptulose 7-phosphate isomerase
MTSHFENLFLRYPALEVIRTEIEQAFNLLRDSFTNGGTLFACGNGGSASDCEHIAGELLKGFVLKRPINSDLHAVFSNKFGSDGANLAGKLQRGLRAISLTSHPAFITAFANDVDADLIFAQQLFVLGKPGDVVILMSTSGNSANIYNCVMVAAAMGIKTILMTGNRNGRCVKMVNLALKMPENETYKIQELHLPVYHALCLMLEEHFYGSNE